ncbi:MAG: hypothetical protein BWY74_01037 [Firmicutes bacterium ADurb.Bin419]|nr:MAG: hypothetical protein BWY74_01037 [Firmicutes bacterium ADurb.Bin419]
MVVPTNAQALCRDAIARHRAVSIGEGGQGHARVGDHRHGDGDDTLGALQVLVDLLEGRLHFGLRREQSGIRDGDRAGGVSARCVGDVGGHVGLADRRLDVDPGVGRIDVSRDDPAEDVVGAVPGHIDRLVVHQKDVVAHVGLADGGIEDRLDEPAAAAVDGQRSVEPQGVVLLLHRHAHEDQPRRVGSRNGISVRVDTDKGAGVDLVPVVHREGDLDPFCVLELPVGRQSRHGEHHRRGLQGAGELSGQADQAQSQERDKRRHASEIPANKPFHSILLFPVFRSRGDAGSSVICCTLRSFQNRQA